MISDSTVMKGTDVILGMVGFYNGCHVGINWSEYVITKVNPKMSDNVRSGSKLVTGIVGGACISIDMIALGRMLKYTIGYILKEREYSDVDAIAPCIELPMTQVAITGLVAGVSPLLISGVDLILSD